MVPPDVSPELLDEFVSEALDHIRAAEAALLDLETDRDDPEAVHTVFRAFHAVKGAAGFLDLDDIQALAHGAENLLEQARNGATRLADHDADLALEACDTLRSLILATGGHTGDEQQPLPDPAELVSRLAHPDDAAEAAPVQELDGTVPRLGDLLVAKGVVPREALEAVAKNQRLAPLGQTLVDSGAASVTDVARALRTQQQMVEALDKDTPAGPSSVRVSTERLDALLYLVGEVIFAHEACPARSDQASTAAEEQGREHSDRMARLLCELQQLTMGIRMVTLRPTFEKMERLVNQLAGKTGKAVRLVTDGAETEIDRTVTEALTDPLLHLIRNAVDHGVEEPQARRQAGKPPTGTIRLAARHEEGHVVIEVADDGRGLDRDLIATHAVQDGLLAPRSRLTDGAALDLLCRPGFSTAREVTDLSGRGVGLDLVRKRVEALQGRLDVASEPGQGATFTLRLPLSMAVTDAVLVRVGDQRYALPLPCIERIFRPEPDAVVRTADGGEGIFLDGELAPVLRLDRLLDVTADDHPSAGRLMLVVTAQGRRLALLADEFLGQQRIVTKPLGKGLGQVAGIAGATVLTDGCVALVLDPPGLRRVGLEHRDDVENSPAENTTASPAPGGPS